MLITILNGKMIIKNNVFLGGIHMSAPIIGISGNKLIPTGNDFLGHPLAYTPTGFVNAIQKAGGLPLIFPISDPQFAKDYIQQIDKLLLTGGQDIAPQFYNEEPHPTIQQIDLARDLFEIALIEEAVKVNKPIFGVCRGLQLLNVYFGGTLYQDLSLYKNWKIGHVQRKTNPIFPTHSISIESKSTLADILGNNRMVNSYHHQAIKELATDLTATAFSKDNIIEAIEFAEQRILAVQWHPELSFETEEKDMALFNYFVHSL